MKVSKRFTLSEAFEFELVAEVQRGNRTALLCLIYSYLWFLRMLTLRYTDGVATNEHYTRRFFDIVGIFETSVQTLSLTRDSCLLEVCLLRTERALGPCTVHTARNTRLAKLYQVRALKQLGNTASLDAPLSDSEDSTLGDILPDTGLSAEDNTMQEEQTRLVAAMLTTVPNPLDQTVISLYFLQGNTLAEIARLLKLPRGRIEYMIRRGLKHLRMHLFHSGYLAAHFM